MCRLLNVLSALSLLLCGAVTALWVRSFWITDRFSFVLQGDRYTASCERGIVALAGPPSATERDIERMASARLVDRIRNDQLSWSCTVWRGIGFLPKYADIPMPREGTPLQQLCDINLKGKLPPPLVRKLLAALEDPERFVAAHVAINYVSPMTLGQWGEQLTWSEASCSARTEYDGFVVELVPGQLDEPKEIKHTAARDYQSVCTVRYQPAAAATLREQWHKRLDVSVASLPLWGIVAGTALLPAGRWLMAAGIRRQRSARRRRGACLVCGYDLRATAERCPECGGV